MRAFTVAGFVLSILIASAASAVPVPDNGTAKQHWECVPIARALSGIQIRGDALTWWSQAEGRYRRGNEPRRGAVLAFKPHGPMALGHVAAVSRVIDDRTILVTHSNWSPINGVRGQIEKDVQVVDVSETGDWSRVRVWYDPNQALGSTAWPVYGFIYPDGKAPMRLPQMAVPEIQSARATDPVRVDGPRPTGRIAYLARLLPKL